MCKTGCCAEFRQPLAKVARVALTGEQTGKSDLRRSLSVSPLSSPKRASSKTSVYYQPLNQRWLTDVTIGEDPLSRLAKG